MKFNCRRCGWCCENIVIDVSYFDIHRWSQENRFDILNEVTFLDNYPHKGFGSFYFLKTARNPKQPCPFLVKENGVSSCAIQDTKPQACRDYPWSHDKMEGCPAFPEVKGKNILKRKQVRESQRKYLKRTFVNRGELLQIIARARHIS